MPPCADLLLARTAELLGWQGQPRVSETVNCDLLDALVAGDVQGVLVCAGQQEAPPPPVETTAEAPVADPMPTPVPEAFSSRLDDVAAAAAAEKEASLPHPSQQQLSNEASHAAPAFEASQLHLRTYSKRNPTVQPQPVLSVHTPATLPLHLAGAPAVYLSRSGTEATGPLQADELGAAVVAMLLPTGPSLTSMHLLLQHVVTPWLAGHQPAQPGISTARQQVCGAADGSGSATALGGGESSAVSAGGDRSRSAAGNDARSLGSVDASASSAAGTPSSTAGSLIPAAAELLLATQKFSSQVVAAAKHLRSEVQVVLPAGVDLRNVGAAAGNEDAVLACERCMEEWMVLATTVVAREGATKLEGRGPLAELDHWQARAEAYGGLVEQLSVPAVRAVMAVVEHGSSDAALSASFRAQLSELGRLGMEARDNARFLTTLERHFRAIDSGSLEAVADAVQPMLNALRMIWVISRYFGDDVHMSNLLERIAHGLQDRLDASLDVATLFRSPAAESLALVRTCLAIARGWQSHYMAQRERIEASLHHARWEFNRALLFEKTNHIAEVCGEVEGMLEAEDDFRQFLGPELKAVTGNTSVIEEVSVMVSCMVEPVEGVAFNPFDRVHAADWRSVRARFARDADDIKLATRDLIDTCFRKLRNVDAAVQLLHSFRRIQTQGAMQQQMADKLAAVLEHFINEISAVRRLFEEGRDAPPLSRNMPPVAGSVKWSRGLLVRLRRTWVRLLGLNSDLELMEQGRRAAAAMTELARDMLRFEKARFAAWCSTVDATVTAGLQQPLLCRQAEAADKDGNADGSGAAGCADAASGGQKAGGGGAAGGKRVAISFPEALLRLTREAKYLDQLGFGVPQLAVNLALQEGQLREHFQELGAMLQRHASTSAALRGPERALLADQLAVLEAALEPGLSRLNWTSLTIPDFVASVNKAVDQFASLVAQVHKNTVLIEKTILHISRAKLLPPDTPAAASSTSDVPAPSSQSGQVQQPSSPQPGSPGTAAAPLAAQSLPGTAVATAGQAAGQQQGSGSEPSSAPDVLDLQEFYEDFEQHRLDVVEGLVTRYRSVGPLLVKVEELVAGSATGKSPRLAGYYSHWERRLFGAVCGMVVSGLQAFHDRLHACRSNGGVPQEGEDAEASKAAKPPLFRVALSLIPPEVVVAPSAAEVGRQLGRLLRNLVESAKPFVRWMDGTCLEAPEQFVYGEDAEPHVFSFFADVSQSPAVIRAMLLAQHEVQRALTGVGKAAERWRSIGALWKVDRPAALVKLQARKLSQAAGEEKLAQYHRVGEDAWAAGTDQDVHFIRVRCAPLASAVRSEAQAWVRGIAGVLAEADAPKLEALNQQAATLLGAVQREVVEEADVEAIQAAIASTLAAAPGASAECGGLAERCRGRWAYVVPSDELAVQAELAAIEVAKIAWGQLLAAATARAQQGVKVPHLAAAASEAVMEGVGGEASRQGHRKSVMPGRIQRSASNASTASTASNKRRGPSRAAASRQ